MCAACHKTMDPIGFALENFDAVGVWRTKDAGFAIDSTGKMFDGAKLDGPVSLRKAILNHTDSFLGTFSEKPVELRHRPACWSRRICQRFARSRATLRRIIIIFPRTLWRWSRARHSGCEKQKQQNLSAAPAVSNHKLERA